MSTTPIPEEEYPFFTAAPAKKSAAGWKIATAILASCLAVTGYLLATGFSLSPAPEGSDTADVTALQSQVDQLIAEKQDLEGQVDELTQQNNQLSARILSLLNECNELTRNLEQSKNGGLTESQVTKMQKDLESTQLVLDSYIAMLRRDKETLSANVDSLMAQVNDLPAEARNALYILLECMDRF